MLLTAHWMSSLDCLNEDLVTDSGGNVLIVIAAWLNAFLIGSAGILINWCVGV